MARDTSSTPGISNKIIHERARLMILTSLAATDEPELSFSHLRDTLELTAGNLSIQLKTLSKARYIAITKRFKDNKPLTTASITPAGRAALTAYVDEMEKILGALRSSA